MGSRNGGDGGDGWRHGHFQSRVACSLTVARFTTEYCPVPIVCSKSYMPTKSVGVPLFEAIDGRFDCLFDMAIYVSDLHSELPVGRCKRPRRRKRP